MLWRIRQNIYEPIPPRTGMETETRRPVLRTMENKSAINTTTHPKPNVATVARSQELLTQTEQVHRQDAKVESKPSLQNEEKLLAKIKELEKKNLRAKTRSKRRQPSTLAGYTMTATGILALAFSVLFSSTILAFIGLGLTFWGALLLFIRPQKYVRSVLMDSTALSSLRTIDRVMTHLGYLEQGIYIPGGNPERAVVFVPSEPYGRIPKAKEIEDQTFIENPKGIAMIPPGLALALLIEKELGVDLGKCSLETLSERLPKLLIEDLEMAQNFEMHVKGDEVRFKFDESIYSDFCHKLASSTRVCAGLGCPICSAMACVLAISTGRPVIFEGDKNSPDGKMLESSYRLLEA
jgi:hypothetical protein